MNSKVNLFKNIVDLISIHKSLRSNPVPYFVANCSGKSNFESSTHKLIVGDQYNYGVGHRLLIVLYFNDLIKWAEETVSRLLQG